MSTMNNTDTVERKGNSRAQQTCEVTIKIKIHYQSKGQPRMQTTEFQRKGSRQILDRF